jgi:hypothetical protein
MHQACLKLALHLLCRRFRAQFWQLCALAFIAANGGTWGDTSILTTNIKASAC